jgi:murein DD-endopeptidase MepM/ murein hydrolase activator NlpD
MAAPGNMKAAIKNTFPTKPAKDSTNIYEEMLNDESDDLMENHPAEDIYNNIWTSEKLNPYKVSLNDLPDSIRINCNGFHMPIFGRVTSKFGPRRYRFHYGIDLALHVGDTIHAAFKGKVRIIDYDPGGYGNYVVIRHENGLETVYAHLSKVDVRLDQNVKAGQHIALGGNTGRSTGPHLHFETRYLGNAINPANLIDFQDGKVVASTYILTKRKNFYYQQREKTRDIAKYYKVRNGDNLSKIAARNGVTVAALKKLNNIKGSSINPGKRLRIR